MAKGREINEEFRFEFIMCSSIHSQQSPLEILFFGQKFDL